MSIVSVKELPRKAVYEIKNSRQLTREWVFVLSDDALTSPMNETELAGYVELGNAHPTYPAYKVLKIAYTEGYEGSPYHVHVVAEYGVLPENDTLSPTARLPVWNFDSAPGEIPALYYFEGSGNTTLRPLTNSAYDYFQGLVTQESTVIARVSQNFTTFPSAWFQSMNCVNNALYFGCPAHTLKVQKIQVEQASEEYSGGVVRYWASTAEIHYRQSGHNLQLPDVGWNFIDSGQKRRCMVFDFENSAWIPSPNPVGLNGNGAQTLGFPAILNRRVNPEVNYQSLFGTPPTAPLL